MYNMLISYCVIGIFLKEREKIKLYSLSLMNSSFTGSLGSGNIAGDSTMCRDYVLDCNILPLFFCSKFLSVLWVIKIHGTFLRKQSHLWNHFGFPSVAFHYSIFLLISPAHFLGHCLIQGVKRSAKILEFLC